MTMSPGRSATQAKPAASTATASRKRISRIIAPSPWPERARRIGGVLTGGRERGLARLRLRDPGLRRRARGVGELAEIGERGRNIGLGRVDFDTRQHRGSIVAGRRIDRPNAHQSVGIGLQPLQEAAFRRLRAGNLEHSGEQGAQAPESGFLERLQANADRLVRIRPVDAPPGDDASAVLARIEIDAAKADIAAALADLGKLADATRAPAQAWIAKAQARQAALAAARQYAADTARALGPR